jgi:O-antigen/teichoic acid export membrane protein
MQIIMLSLFFIFINFPIGSLLNACDKQRKNTYNMVLITITSIALNLVLIPKFQATGASITVLITNALMTFLGFYWVNKTIQYNKKRVLITLIKTTICSIIMGALAFYLKAYLNIFIVIGLGGISYFILLFILKGFRKEYIISIYNSIIPKIKN